MTLSEISIKRPVFAWMLMAGLIIFGGLSFRLLGVSQMPDVDFPVVNCSLSLVGAAPEVMETQVVDPIEDAIMEIEGIRTVTSTSRQGSANISVEFELGRNIDVAVQEISNHIAHVQANLPTNLDPPTIRKSNPEDQPIIWLALTSDGKMPLHELMMYARNVLFDQFSTIEGVGDIGLGGYVVPNLRVWLAEDKLNRYELTVDDVITAIKGQQVDLPSGRLENATNESNVRLLGESGDPKEFAKITVGTRGGSSNFRPVALTKLARIEEGLADVRRISRSDGHTAVGLGILKQHGSNAVQVADNIKAKLDDIRKSLPPGLTLDIRNDSTRFIRQSVDELNFTLFLSAILTSIVCFLFLGSWSSTLNVLMAIPTSVIGAFIVLHFCGFTLNTFTLLGLSLAIGIVVDDAIMMLENIVRHGEMGKPRKLAALDGSKEITFAALAATVAVVAIFLPVIFMKGIIGRYLFHYGITVTAAVLLSLLEAITLTPMRCSRFLRVGKHMSFLERGMDWLMRILVRWYSACLRLALRWPSVTVLVSLLIVIPTYFAAKTLPSELAPAQDQGTFLLRFKAPVGSSLDFTDGKFKQAEAYLLHQVPEVTALFSSVGGFGGDAVNEGMMFVTLKDKKDRALSQHDVMDVVRKGLGGMMGKVKVIVQDMSLRGFSSGRGFPVEVTLNGPDWERLGQLVTETMAKMTDSGIMTDVNSDYQIGMPEVRVTPDRTKAAQRGVNLTAVSNTINALIGGQIMGSATQYPKGGHKYDIRVRLEGKERITADDIKRLKIRNNRGEIIPLGDVVTITEKPTPQIISRINRQRAVAVYANVVKGKAQDEALKWLEKAGKELPPGYSIQLTGSAQTFREAIQSLLMAMVLGIFVSYMVLASQFNSFVHPLSILAALPFSLCGAIFGLAWAHQSINMFSIIGLILLLGIVKKNSILLVDFANQQRRSGITDVKAALLAACPVRLRPILMTSVATIAGAVPSALAFGPGAETRVPMAIAIIGGVLLSTGLTLVVVPCVYCLLSKIESKQVDVTEDEPVVRAVAAPGVGHTA